MYERLLSETVQYMAKQKDRVVPLKKLWMAISSEGRKHSFTVPSLADFGCLLDADLRFEFIGPKVEPDITESHDLMEAEILGELGFLESQKVKLRRVMLPGDEDFPEEEQPAVPGGEEDLDLLLDKEELQKRHSPEKNKKNGGKLLRKIIAHVPSNKSKKSLQSPPEKSLSSKSRFRKRKK
jgi:hypothetical protein